VESRNPDASLCLPVHGIVLPGPEHDAGHADWRVLRRRWARAGAGAGPGPGGAARCRGGEAGAARGGGRVEVAPALAQLRRRLVEALQKRHPRADIAGPLPGQGEAALRRRAARGRKGCGRGGGGKVEVEAAEAGVANRHLQRRSRVIA
jgi:hypothetical protein